MDEVGRGTGTADGLSIAWAVCEYLLDHIKCRALFATHYHELSMIGHPRMANRSMEVLDNGGEIVFLRKLKEGPSAESYGLHVARLAGLNDGVLNRAAEIMARLKEGEKALRDALPVSAGLSAPSTEAPPLNAGSAVSVANDVPVAQLLEDLAALDLDRVTPLQALNFISAWKALMDGGTYGAASGKPAAGKSARRQPAGGDTTPQLFDF
jgi:DNA mismatch repair protein MutS